MTDIVGLRVVTYIESDARRVCKLLEEAFNVHPDSSLDKAQELGIDKVGYRSVHLVCDQGHRRSELPESIQYRDILFEVQIRTVLQHAWAEIEHDRGYKLSGTLPSELARRLRVLAGTPELVDREFDHIVTEIDQYARAVVDAAGRGNLDIELNRTSLVEFLETRLRQLCPKGLELSLRADPASGHLLVSELRCFGLNSLADVERLLDRAIVADICESEGEQNEIGLLRSRMILKDIDLYFGKAWQEHWSLASGPEVAHWE